MNQLQDKVGRVSDSMSVLPGTVYVIGDAERGWYLVYDCDKRALTLKRGLAGVSVFEKDEAQAIIKQRAVVENGLYMMPYFGETREVESQLRMQ